MEINGKDIKVRHDPRTIAEIIHSHWQGMYHQDGEEEDSDKIVPYTSETSLSEDFFLFRDHDAVVRAEKAVEDEDFEGMIEVVDGVVVVNSPTPPDVQEIVDHLLK